MSTLQVNHPNFTSTPILQSMLTPYEILENESAERCSGLMSPCSRRSYRPRVMRSAHCITNERGEFLIDLTDAVPLWSTDPLLAMASSHAWLSSTVAAARLHRLREVLPMQMLGLALVVMSRQPNGEWKVISTNGFGRSSLQEQQRQREAM